MGGVGDDGGSIHLNKKNRLKTSGRASKAESSSDEADDEGGREALGEGEGETEGIAEAEGDGDVEVSSASL